MSFPEIDTSEVGFTPNVLNAVTRDQTNITNVHLPSPNPISSYPVPQARIAHQEELSERASDVYARILLTKGIGYPLWKPEPTSYPQEYAVEGVNIGDVGEITYNGKFNFLFNVCLPRDHPINIDAPPDLEPIKFNQNRDVDVQPNTYPRGSVIASQSIIKTVEPHVESQNRGSSSVEEGRFHFTCEPRHGALLVLPDSAIQFDHRFRGVFKTYAQRHAQSWYQHANGTLGSEAHNGSLYLVTGADKSSNWCLASYSNRSHQTAFQVTADTASAYSTRRCLWQSSGLVDSRTCSIPGENIPPNQCVFIRGYKLAVNENLFERKFVGPVKVTDIVTMKPSDVLAKGKSIPGVSKLFSVVPFFGKGGGSSDQADAASGKEVNVEEFPDLGESYHPSTSILLHLLQTNQEADVAIMHDDVWCSVLTEEDQVVPGDTEMLKRILEKYRLVKDGGESMTPSSPTRLICISLALMGEMASKETSVPASSPTRRLHRSSQHILLSPDGTDLPSPPNPSPPVPPPSILIPHHQTHIHHVTYHRSPSPPTLGILPPRYSPTSPRFTPTSSRYTPTSSGYTPTTPRYTPSTPRYTVPPTPRIVIPGYAPAPVIPISPRRQCQSSKQLPTPSSRLKTPNLPSSGNPTAASTTAPVPPPEPLSLPNVSSELSPPAGKLPLVERVDHEFNIFVLWRKLPIKLNWVSDKSFHSTNESCSKALHNASTPALRRACTEMT